MRRVSEAIVFAASLLLVGLLFFERRDHLPGKLLTKLPLSFLFILTALLQIGSPSEYHYLLLTGLSCCLVGDGCLVFSRQGIFLGGLVAFLLGHCFYVAAFLSLAGINVGFWWALVLTGLFGYGVFRWLQPHLNGMRRPVVAYILVISLMLCTAVAVYVHPSIPLLYRRLILAGALAFYLSDLFVARQRFVQQGFSNRLAGLPLYYAGQFCLALTAGFS